MLSGAFLRLDRPEGRPGGRLMGDGFSSLVEKELELSDFADVLGGKVEGGGGRREGGRGAGVIRALDVSTATVGEGADVLAGAEAAPSRLALRRLFSTGDADPGAPGGSAEGGSRPIAPAPGGMPAGLLGRSLLFPNMFKPDNQLACCCVMIFALALSALTVLVTYSAYPSRFAMSAAGSVGSILRSLYTDIYALPSSWCLRHRLS